MTFIFTLHYDIIDIVADYGQSSIDYYKIVAV